MNTNSLAAYEKVQVTVRELQTQVLECIAQQGPITPHAILAALCTRHPERSYSTITPRLSELEDMELIRKDGYETNANGNRCDRWVATGLTWDQVNNTNTLRNKLARHRTRRDSLNTRIAQMEARLLRLERQRA